MSRLGEQKNESPEKPLPGGEGWKEARFMDYEFVATCTICGNDFSILWVMDKLRVGPESVAKIACPVCGESFYQKAGGLIPFKAQGREGLPTGRPVRTVELVYDCPCCGMHRISMALVHTDLSWEDLSNEAVQTTVCNNTICSQRGLQQEVKPTRTGLGTLNPSWS